jgi:hypothetical protein
MNPPEYQSRSIVPVRTADFLAKIYVFQSLTKRSLILFNFTSNSLSSDMDPAEIRIIGKVVIKARDAEGF